MHKLARLPTKVLELTEHEWTAQFGARGGALEPLRSHVRKSCFRA
ncbi:hypothetical protein [Rhizobium sp. Root1220]|nr:hypothetical protein [Rhizobium sp. Root1220]